MPKLKQPSSLETTAMKTLVEVSVRCCDQLSTEGTLQTLREGISVIKEDVCSRIPWCSLPEFCTTFLKKFSEKSRYKRHLEAASEILLDVEFVGLRCNRETLKYMNPQHVNRLRGLVELDLISIDRLPSILEDYQLTDLTTLIFTRDCSDHDLTVIGRNCLKLRVLKLRGSRITDEGLRALSSCSELRVVHISNCYEVTHIGVNLLISEHDKLEELSYCYPTAACGIQPDGFRFLSSLNRPCLVIKCLVVGTTAVTNANLRSIVSMFSNLTHFGTICKSVEDLSILKSLGKLAEISLYLTTYYDDSRAWESLKELLTFVGGNIKTLRFGELGRGEIIHISEETGLDFIFHNCPNIEYLEFDNGRYDLVLPPFEKLKTLRLKATHTNVYPHYSIKLLKIGRMVNLEVFSILNFKVRFPTVKGIMLNNVKFPKLIRIEDRHVSKIDEIEAIARNRNLDFKICGYKYRPWLSGSKN